MVSFDSAQAGTPAGDWIADPRWNTLPTFDLEQFSEVVVVAAHPDDETLGAGGLIAECGLRGIPVTVVIVTDGAASHPDSPTTTPLELAKRRAVEVTQAVTGLHSDARVVRLGFADGQVKKHFAPMAVEIDHAVPQTPAGRVLLATNWRGDNHPDHALVAEASRQVAENRGFTLAEYPIWLWHWATPATAEVPWESFVRLPLSPLAKVLKGGAIAEHGSQISPLSDQPGDEAMLLPGFLEHFTGEQELFVATTQHVPSAQQTRQAGMEPGYFDKLYEKYDDPWQFADRWYEKRKRALTLASLPAERYASVLELGCSIGVLTQQLAGRADSLIAVDLSAAAVERARERLAGTAADSHVRIEQRDISEGLPDGEFDLIVLSEVGYYFDREDLTTLLDRIERHLSATGTLVLCHWRHPVADYPLRGDDVHGAMLERGTLVRVSAHAEADFLLDVYTRTGISVADAEGLVS